MGKCFRRKLRRRFESGDLGPLSRYASMDFSSLPGPPPDYIVLGALEYLSENLEYLSEKYKKDGSLSKKVCDIQSIFTNVVPIFVPTKESANLQPTEKKYERLIMGRRGVYQTYESIWREILRNRHIDKNINDIDEKKLIKILTESYKERLAQGKAAGSVLSGN